MDRPLILGRYRPLATSGAGASGTVEIAWDTRIQRRVAIKRIPLTDDPAGAVSHILAEARTAAMLSHPNIVQVLDFEVEGREALIIMEYVDGVTLADILDDADEPLSLDAIAAVVHSVADALSFAHENQVLHLDIKPENVLVGKNGIVKVSDFGLASLSGAQGFTAARGGTIGYMPPEQISGQPVDARTDEWALAAMTYEMLTLQNPFAARDLNEALRLANYGDVDLPSEVRDDVAPGIDGIILDALSPAPDVRFPRVETFEAVLAPFLGSSRRGRIELRELANTPEELEPENNADERVRPAGLWERVPERAWGAIARIVTALACAWLVWVGLTPTTLEPMPTYLVIAAIAAVGAIVPQLGGVLAYIVVGVGAIAAGSVPGGVVAIVAALAWWAAAARLSNTSVAITLGSVFAAIAHLPGFAMLLAGFALPPRRAIPTALFAGLLILVCAPLTGSSWLYALGLFPQEPNAVVGLSAAYGILLKSPRTWFTIAGWVLACACMSALCTRGTRFAGLLGAFLGAGIMTLCQLLAQRVAAGGVWSLPQLAPALSILVSFILVGTICVLGAPLKAEQPEELHDQQAQAGFR